MREWVRSLGFWVLVTLGVAASVPGGALAAEQRLGLVIGEARYPSQPMTTPANDAGIVAQALASAGFEVTGYADLDAAGVRRALAGFLDKARQAGPDAVAFIYLAGRGVQFSGDNYLVPVDAHLMRDIDVPSQAVRLSDFSRDLAALPLKARVLVLDLAHAHAPMPGLPPLAPGLAAAEPPAASIMAFNAAPGMVGGPEFGSFSLFAEALSEMIDTKGISLATLFSRLRLRVAALSNGADVPWSSGDAGSSLVLFPPSGETSSLLEPLKALVSTPSPADAFWTAIKRDTLQGYADFVKSFPDDPLTPRVRVLLAARREATMWLQTQKANSAAAYWTYMRFYPRGPHFGDARRLLAALPAALEPPPRFDIVTYADVPMPRPDERAGLAGPAGAKEDAAPVPPPAGADLPEIRSAYYDRVFPLLAVTASALPLSLPVEGRAAGGRIVQPGDGQDEAVTASMTIDKAKRPVVTQTGADGRVLSVATTKLEPSGAMTIIQTGPDGQTVAATSEAVDAHGSRTVTQIGRDKQILARSSIVIGTGGDRILTMARGESGAPQVATTTAARTFLRLNGASDAPPAPVILARAALTPKAAEPAIAAAPTATLVSQAPPVMVPAATPAPLPAAPAPSAPSFGALAPAEASTPSAAANQPGALAVAAPGASRAQPMGPPTVPIVSAPIEPVAPGPSSAAGGEAPPRVSSPAVSPPPPAAVAPKARSGTAPPSEPVPPRRTRVAAETAKPPAPLPHAGKAKPTASKPSKQEKPPAPSRKPAESHKRGASKPAAGHGRSAKRKR